MIEFWLKMARGREGERIKKEQERREREKERKGRNK